MRQAADDDGGRRGNLAIEQARQRRTTASRDGARKSDARGDVGASGNRCMTISRTPAAASDIAASTLAVASGAGRRVSGRDVVRHHSHRCRSVGSGAVSAAVHGQLTTRSCSPSWRSCKRRIGCRRDVTLCESTTIGTPATIGWRRPLVLLPADWREWNATDRRAVIAHELAHVARGDYLSGVVARLTTALHFYHPLAHWLARRMRFEQELAADACGVACSGGKESYVVALARMALYQDNRALAWAARPFLPSRSTFLRRIEMLRNTYSELQTRPFAPATRRLLLAGLAAVAFVIAGLRGPMHSSDNVPRLSRRAARPRRRRSI